MSLRSLIAAVLELVISSNLAGVVYPFKPTLRIGYTSDILPVSLRGDV